MITQTDEKSDTTKHTAYANRLVRLETAWWKQILDVQAPYRWNLQRLRPGLTLEIGCGIGRNLRNLTRVNSAGAVSAVGIDHNETSVKIALGRGLTAFTAEDFLKSSFCAPGTFDSLLFAHVAEHMSFAQCAELLTGYKKYIKIGGKLILITPQEAGYRSDPTHVEFMDFAKLEKLQLSVGTIPTKNYSFPFPRSFGTFFKYNEFVAVSIFS